MRRPGGAPASSSDLGHARPPMPPGDSAVPRVIPPSPPSVPMEAPSRPPTACDPADPSECPAPEPRVSLDYDLESLGAGVSLSSLTPVVGFRGAVHPAKHSRTHAGERFLLDLDGRHAAVVCELHPRPRLRVLLEGKVQMETGLIHRGLKVQVLGQYDVECKYHIFALGNGLGVHVDQRPVAHSFWDPQVLLMKARLPAFTFTACLCAQTLLMHAFDCPASPTWQRPFYLAATVACALAAAVWGTWPEVSYWTTLVLACFETFGVSTVEATSWVTAADVSALLVTAVVLVLVAAKMWLVYMMARCLP